MLFTVDHVLWCSLVVTQHDASALVVLVIGLLPLVDELVLDLGVFGVALDVLADGYRADDEADDCQNYGQFNQSETLLTQRIRAAYRELECLFHDVDSSPCFTDSSCK
ncbi:hypothetical protein D3C71_1755810 [compost metagenome]